MANNHDPLENDLPEEIKDYRSFKEGQVFPPLNKKIHILIVVEGNYIVFLDEEFHVHWWYDSSYGDFAEGFGDVLARQADLEAASRLLLKKSQFEAFGRLLGESIARLLDDRSLVYATQTLKTAADFLKARSFERARVWFLSATLAGTLIFLVSGAVFWKNKLVILTYFALPIGAADVFLGATMGSLGALISVLLRSNRLQVDPSAGPLVHYFEGAMRVLIGALAGMFFVMAVKSNLLLGTINQSQNVLTILLVLSIVAGASEQLLPNLINQISAVLAGGIKRVKIVDVKEEILSEQEPKEESLSSGKKEAETNPKKEQPE
jgi:hypothetical protein